MKILITGDAGFVGRHFGMRFRYYGHQVFGLDIADQRCPRDCRDAFRDNKYQGMDLVIHAAATIPDISQRAKNQMTVANDIALDAEMFQWAMRTEPGCVVYFSSSAAYPGHLQTGGHALAENDLDLNHLSNPHEMYGITKLVGEIQAAEARRLGLNVIVVRPFTGYGTDQDPSYPFRAMINRVLAKEDPLEVWGDGNQVRDFIHIDDIVGTVLTMYAQKLSGPVNLGTGVPTTMLEFARKVCDAAGTNPKIRTRPEMPAGVPYRVADTRNMDVIRPAQVSLEQGIQRALGMA